MTPSCVLAGIVATPPADWFNVPLEDAPPGHIACQMLRTGDDEVLRGVLRLRAVTAPADEFRSAGYDALVRAEAGALESMGLALAGETMWIRDEVRVAGAGFRDGSAFGVAATFPASGAEQEVHFLLFRSDTAKYLFTLITPHRDASETDYRRNTRDFGTVVQSLDFAPQ